MMRALRLLVLAVLLFCFALPVGALTPISGTLSGTHHWTKPGSPYRLTGDALLASGSSLTIDPGVRVEAAGSYTFTLAGSLQIAASAATPVTFTSTSTAPGSWGGVYFAPTATAAVTGANFTLAGSDVTVDGATVSFTDCRFTDAAQDGVVVFNAAQFTASGCGFSRNGRRGLYVETVYPQGFVTSSTFADNGEYPTFLKANCVGMLGTGLHFARNGKSQIGVSTSAAQDVTRTQTWRSQSVPLNLAAGSSDALTVATGATLTLQAPLVVLCRRVQVEGALHCGQAGSAQVDLLGPTATPGSWEGVQLAAGASAAFRGARVRYATTGVTGGSAQVTAVGSDFSFSQFDGISLSGSSQMALTDCLLWRNGRQGLHVTGAATGSVSGGRFLENGDYPAFLEARNVPLLGSGNRYWGNGKQRLGAACGADPDLAVGAAWTNQGIPYDLTARPGATRLTVGAGGDADVGAGDGGAGWGGSSIRAAGGGRDAGQADPVPARGGQRARVVDGPRLPRGRHRPIAQLRRGGCAGGRADAERVALPPRLPRSAVPNGRGGVPGDGGAGDLQLRHRRQRRRRGGDAPGPQGDLGLENRALHQRRRSQPLPAPRHARPVDDLKDRASIPKMEFPMFMKNLFYGFLVMALAGADAHAAVQPAKPKGKTAAPAAAPRPLEVRANPGAPAKILIVTGCDMHAWRLTTPLLVAAIAADKRIEVSVTEDVNDLGRRTLSVTGRSC